MKVTTVPPTSVRTVTSLPFVSTNQITNGSTTPKVMTNQPMKSADQSTPRSMVGLNTVAMSSIQPNLGTTAPPMMTAEVAMSSLMTSREIIGDATTMNAMTSAPMKSIDNNMASPTTAVAEVTTSSAKMTQEITNSPTVMEPTTTLFAASTAGTTTELLTTTTTTAGDRKGR